MMRNLLLSLIIISVLSLAGIYLSLPAKITFSKVIVIKKKINIANRFLMDQNKWGKWFPSSSVDNLPARPDKNAYRYNNYFYSIERKMMNAAEVSITNNETSLKSLINMISINDDSVAIEWKSEMPESSNPINRIRNYIKAKELKNNMADILRQLQTFLGVNENVYGLNIKQIKVTDTILISTRHVTSDYPSTSIIYSLIKDLKYYILKQGAQETNYPMLNVNKDSGVFKTMVAIPINKLIPEKNNFLFKRMVPGKILVTEIKGGIYTTREAFKQLEIYMADYHLSSPAIPFESLITDRTKEPDTAKWITRIYYPIY